MSMHSSSVWIVDGLVRFATFHDDPGMHERRSHVHVTGQWYPSAIFNLNQSEKITIYSCKNWCCPDNFNWIIIITKLHEASFGIRVWITSSLLPPPPVIIGLIWHSSGARARLPSGYGRVACRWGRQSKQGSRLLAHGQLEGIFGKHCVKRVVIQYCITRVFVCYAHVIHVLSACV